MNCMLSSVVVPVHQGHQVHHVQRVHQPRADPLQQHGQRALHSLPHGRLETWSTQGHVHLHQAQPDPERDQGGPAGWFGGWAECLPSWWGELRLVSFSARGPTPSEQLTLPVEELEYSASHCGGLCCGLCNAHPCPDALNWCRYIGCRGPLPLRYKEPCMMLCLLFSCLHCDELLQMRSFGGWGGDSIHVTNCDRWEASGLGGAAPH